MYWVKQNSIKRKTQIYCFLRNRATPEERRWGLCSLQKREREEARRGGGGGGKNRFKKLKNYGVGPV
jgi:hypothetical protein